MSAIKKIKNNYKEPRAFIIHTESGEQFLLVSVDKELSFEEVTSTFVNTELINKIEKAPFDTIMIKSLKEDI